MSFSAFSPGIALALALVPALVTWSQYRALFQGGESAVFAERVAQVRNRVAVASAISTALILVFLSDSALWAIMLLLLGLACASHGPRKALLGETWSLAQFIEWRARLMVGTFGFWLLLAFTPAILRATPQSALWGMTLALVVAQLAWHHLYDKILLALIKATPFQRPDLELFFAPILAVTTAPAPTVWRAGAPGGVLANAFALPHTRRGGVLFFDTLLERLEPREIAAIFAHEVAHLEQFDSRRLRQRYLLTAFAIAGVVTASGGLVMGAPSFAWVASTFTPLGVFVGLGLRAQRMQADETSSDRRAIALCGDAEALISGLTRLHAIHHMPRRVSTETEQNATHPSLARRIRAIREGAGERRAQPLLAPAVLTCIAPGRLAILEQDRLTLVWADPGAPGLLADPIGVAKRIEATAYDQLTELRLSTATDGTVRLAARSLDGRRWTVALQPGEAARAQDALNVVDQLLAPPKTRSHAIPRRAVALVALLVTGVLQMLWPIVVPALLALARPARPILVALASALVATAYLTGADSRLDALRVLLLGLLAGAAVWQASRMTTKAPAATRTEAESSRIETIVLALAALLACAWIALVSRDLYGLHLVARDTAWPTASFIALSVYLGLAQRKVAQRAGIACGVLTAAAFFIGSSGFLTRVIADPLVADTRDFAERSIELTPVANTAVEGLFDQLRLAPDGRSVLLSETADEEDTPERRGHVVAGFDGWSRPVDAAHATLAGADRIVLLDRRDGESYLRSERLRAGGPVWTLKVPGNDALKLTAGPDGRWHLMKRERNAFTRVDGRVGTAAVSRTSWSVEAAPTEYVSFHDVGAGTVGFGVAVEWAPSSLPWWWLPGWNWGEKTTLLRVEGEATRRLTTSRLNVSCAEPTAVASGYLCVAFDGRRSRFWRYNVAGDALEPAGQAPGQFFFASQQTDTKMTAMRGGAVTMVDLETARVTSFVLRGNPIVMAYDVTDEFVAISRIIGTQTTVTLYRLAEDPAESAAFASTR